MSWEVFAGQLKRENKFDEIVSYLTYFPDELARSLLGHLLGVDYRPKSEVALTLLEEEAPAENFRWWSEAPWRELARRGSLELLVAALDDHYRSVADMLTQHQELWPRLFEELEKDESPGLTQWVEEVNPPLDQGSRGWQRVWLLCQRALPGPELVPFLHHEVYQSLAREQLVRLDYQEALRSLLVTEAEDWDLLPVATGPRALALQAVLHRGVVTHELLREACANRSQAVGRICQDHRYPAFQEWYQELTGHGLEFVAGECPACESEWRALLEEPLDTASEKIQQWDQENFLPLHRPDLFDRAVELTREGAFPAVGLEWKEVAELPPGEFHYWEDQVFSYSEDLDLITGWQPDRGLKRYSLQEFFGPIKQICPTPIGFLLYNDDLRMIDFEGRTLWRHGRVQGALGLSPDKTWLAVGGGTEVKLIELASGEVLRQSELIVLEPSRHRGGGMWIVSLDPQGRGLTWSDDGRWLLSYYRDHAYLWEAESLELKHSFQLESGVTRVAFCKGKVLVVGGGQLDNTIFGGGPQMRLYCPESGELLSELRARFKVHDLSIEGDRLVSWSWSTIPLLLQSFSLTEDGLCGGQVVPLAGTGEDKRDLRPQAVRGSLVLVKGGLVDLKRGTCLVRWEGSGVYRFQKNQARLIRIQERRIAVSELFDRRPVEELSAGAYHGAASQFVALVQEVGA